MKLAVARAAGHFELICFELDRSVLPDGCSELLRALREVGCNADLAQRPGGLVSLEKSFLGGVEGMGVHRQIFARQAQIAQFGERLFR